MTTDTTTLRVYVAAVTRMLLGKNVRMAHSVAITGGGVLCAEGKLEFIHAVVASDTDVIQLAFAAGRAIPALADIDVFVPRNGACSGYSACRLWLADGASRAVILPRDEVRGHFALRPGALVHVNGKPRECAAAAGQFPRCLARHFPTTRGAFVPSYR